MTDIRKGKQSIPNGDISHFADKLSIFDAIRVIPIIFMGILVFPGRICYSNRKEGRLECKRYVAACRIMTNIRKEISV